MRPTISPATKTATMTKASIPYSPEPTPPKTTSLNSSITIGTNPPSGVYESCIELTEPFEAAVVAVAQSAESASPKRTSLPSMLPPGFVSLEIWFTPNAPIFGLPDDSAAYATNIIGIKIMNIAARTAQPWRVSPTILPKV